MSDTWGNDPLVSAPPKSGDKGGWGNDPLKSGTEPPAGGMSWADTAGKAITNIPSSAYATGESMYNAVRHPMDTAEALYHVGAGEAEKLIPGQQSDEKYADAVNGFFAHRYGSIEHFKEAIANDPVGVATDLSTVFTGPGGLLAKAPGIAGKTGEIVSKIGEVINPVNAAVKTVGKVAPKVAPLAGKGAAELIGHLGTHTGADPLKIAAQAGRAGGTAAETFLDNMRGNAPVEDVVTSAKAAVAQMRRDKGKDYRSGMDAVSKDKSIIDFKPVDDAMAKAASVKKFKGEDIQPETAETRKQIEEILTHWKGLPRGEFHTPEGMDALKQRLGSVMENLPYNSPQRHVAETAYNAVKTEITKQFPQYAKVMKDYSTASDLISEIERSLSLGKKSTADTALRKLQSLMRNNVTSNYGQRAKLGDELTKRGATNLQHALAGQALSKATPRGLGGAVASSELGGSGIAALMGHPGVLAAAIPTLALQSPRLMGEAAYGLGASARYLSTPAGKAALRALTKGGPYAAEAGRTPDIANDISSPGF